MFLASTSLKGPSAASPAAVKSGSCHIAGRGGERGKDAPPPGHSGRKEVAPAWLHLLGHLDQELQLFSPQLKVLGCHQALCPPVTIAIVS